MDPKKEFEKLREELNSVPFPDKDWFNKEINVAQEKLIKEYINKIACPE